MENQNSDTAIVATETATIAPTIEQLTIEVKFYLNQMGQNAIEVGKRLTAAKAMLPHGQFQDWLKDNFNLKYRMAANFMAIAERFSKVHSNALFSQTQMIALLALPEGEEETFIEEKAAEGKPVEDMAVKKLREEVKQWKAKAEEAQNKVKGLAAENTNMEMTLDAARKESEMQQRKIAVETKRREDAENNFDFMMRERDRAESWSKKLQTQLDELKKQPPVEIVPADYEENKKAVADLQNKISDLQNQLDAKTVEVVPPADYNDTKAELEKAKTQLAELQGKHNEQLRKEFLINRNLDQLFFAASFLQSQPRYDLTIALQNYDNAAIVSNRLLQLTALLDELNDCFNATGNDQN